MNEGSNTPGADPRVTALDRMLELTVLLHDDATQSLAREGLTPSRAALLWQIHHRGPMTQRALAEALGVSPRNVTQLVDALEAGGFVARRPHPTDRRATLVTFTERGTAVVEAMQRQQDEFVGLLFDGMPEPQFRAFLGGLEEVLRRLHEVGLAHRPSEDGP